MCCLPSVICVRFLGSFCWDALTVSPAVHSVWPERTTASCIVHTWPNIPFYFILFIYWHFINPLREIWAALPGYGYTAAARAALAYPILQVHAGSFHVFRNPPDSDMDYRRVYVIILMHAYIYTQGLGSESAQHFWLGKTHKFFFVLLMGFELGSWNPLDLESDALAIEPPRPPKGESLYGCPAHAVTDVLFLSFFLFYFFSRTRGTKFLSPRTRLLGWWDVFSMLC